MIFAAASSSAIDQSIGIAIVFAFVGFIPGYILYLHIKDALRNAFKSNATKAAEARLAKEAAAPRPAPVRRPPPKAEQASLAQPTRPVAMSRTGTKPKAATTPTAEPAPRPPAPTERQQQAKAAAAQHAHPRPGHESQEGREARYAVENAAWYAAREAEQRQLKAAEATPIGLSEPVGEPAPASVEESPPVAPNVEPVPTTVKTDSHSGTGIMNNASLGTSQNIPESMRGNTFVSDVSREMKIAVAERDGWICQLCLQSIDRNLDYDYDTSNPRRLEIDHINPRANDGGSEMWNLQATHSNCNRIKSDHLVTNDEWREQFADLVEGRRLHGVEETSKIRRVGSQEGMSAEQRSRSDIYWSAEHSQMTTTCQNGHEWREETTMYTIRKGGDRAGRVERTCRTCRKAWKAQRKAQAQSVSNR